MLEGVQARRIKAIDGQRDQEFFAIVRGEDDRSTAAELRKSALDQHAIG